jgi:hypothetical protein
VTGDMAGQVGVIYLLHFDKPYKHARHYTGWTESSGSLKARPAHHARGDGARLLEVVHAAGITWQLARTWDGPRALERRIKRQGGASRHCPLCLAGGASKAQHRELAAADTAEGADPWPTA